MLVLTRKRGEEIVIGRNIHVTVISVRGDKVRLGFTAPAEVPVHRKEVHEQIQRDSPTRSPTEATTAIAVAQSCASREPVLTPVGTSSCV